MTKLESIKTIASKRASIAGLIILAGIGLAACSGAPEENTRTITLNGTVELVAGPLPAGTIYYRLFVLEAYPDQEKMSHPLAEIEDFSSETGSFTHTFEYPVDKGTGLAIHAWVDADGDEAFCTMENRQEPGGLAWVEETPEDEIDMKIVLTANCRSAGWFYPTRPDES